MGEAAYCAFGRSPITRPQLKKLVYGTDRPSRELSTECAKREARRVVEKHIGELEAAFPIGFGLMCNEIRSWRAASAK